MIQRSANPASTVRHCCSGPPLELVVPTGVRHSFEVRAVANEWTSDVAQADADLRERVEDRGSVASRLEAFLAQSRTDARTSDQTGEVKRGIHEEGVLPTDTQKTTGVQSQRERAYAPSERFGEAVFELQVQLADGQAKTLEFYVADDLQKRAATFVEQSSLRDLFLEPLLGHMELMVHMAKHQDSLDIIDLL